MKRFVVLVALAMGLAVPGSAEEDVAALAREASDALGFAAVALSEAEGASDRIGALTETIHAYERGLSAMRDGLRSAALEERALSARLAGQDAELGDMLVLLQQVTRASEARMVLHPGGAVETVRAGFLTAALIPALEERSRALQRDLTDLSALRSVQEGGIATLEEGLSGVRQARLELAQAVSERNDLPATLATDDAAMEALLNSSETLAAFADSLVPNGGGDAEPPAGDWAMPAIGRIVRGFDEADAAGVRRPGWVLATAAEALVSAPAPASVRFVGEIPAQGQVVILETSPGRLMILAGLEQVLVGRGQIVSRGDPLGLMGGRTAPAQEKLNETAVLGGQPRGETLYIEIRQGQAPVNPEVFLRPQEE